MGFEYRTVGSVEVIKGIRGCGMVEELAAAVRCACEQGSAGDIMVVAPTSLAASELKALIGLDEVRVLTPFQVALGVLGAPEAVAKLGREPRVALGFETSFLLEDMRMTGQNQRRLREMLKFFQRSWSEMREDEQGWYVTGEEQAIDELARARMAFLGAYHPAEVANQAVRYLAADGDALAAAQVGKVYCSGYGSLSRASQMLLTYLAAQDLTVTWDDACAPAGEEPYAYAEGLGELLAANPAVRVTELGELRCPVAIASVTNALLAQECMGGRAALPVASGQPEGSVTFQTLPDIEDEAPRIVELVREAIAAGCAPRDILVAAPSDSWGIRIAKTLGEAGIDYDYIGDRQVIGGDVRDAGKSAAAAVYNALHLLSAPTSAIAWRAWCGFGDYLTNSVGAGHLYEAARPFGFDFARALAWYHDMRDMVEVTGGQKLLERYEEGRALIAACQGLAGEELLAAVSLAATGSPEVPPMVRAMLGGVCGEAAAMEAAIYANLLEPTFDAGCVRVCTWGRMVDVRCATLVMCGLINGIAPGRPYFDLIEASHDDQVKLHRKLIEGLYVVSAAATQRIVGTGAASSQIELAEMLKLKSERVRLVGGSRVVTIAPSVAMDYMTGRTTTKINL